MFFSVFKDRCFTILYKQGTCYSPETEALIMLKMTTSIAENSHVPEDK